MVLRIRSILRAHQRYDGQVDARAAILPLVASTLQKTVNYTVWIMMLDNVFCNQVSQSISRSRFKERISEIVPNASNDIPRNRLVFHLIQVLAQVSNGTNCLGNKHDPIGVLPLQR